MSRFSKGCPRAAPGQGPCSERGVGSAGAGLGGGDLRPAGLGDGDLRPAGLGGCDLRPAGLASVAVGRFGFCFLL